MSVVAGQMSGARTFAVVGQIAHLVPSPRLRVVRGFGRTFQPHIAEVRVVQPDEGLEFGVAGFAGQRGVRERPALVAVPAQDQGRFSTSTLGGSTDGSRCCERRTIEKAAAPAASTTTAAPASTQGRGLRRRERRACASASGRPVTTSWAAVSS